MSVNIDRERSFIGFFILKDYFRNRNTNILYNFEGYIQGNASHSFADRANGSYLLWDRQKCANLYEHLNWQAAEYRL